MTANPNTACKPLQGERVTHVSLTVGTMRRDKVSTVCLWLLRERRGAVGVRGQPKGWKQGPEALSSKSPPKPGILASTADLRGFVATAEVKTSADERVKVVTVTRLSLPAVFLR